MIWHDQSSMHIPPGGYELINDQDCTLVYTLLLALLLIAFPITSTSSVGDIDQLPLFLKSGANPNILLLVDDSTSMNNETLVEGLYPYTTAGVEREVNFRGRYSIHTGRGEVRAERLFDDDKTKTYMKSFVLTMQAAKDVKAALDDENIAHSEVHNWEEAAKGVWRARNHNFNTLYYNPGIDYMPWVGFNDQGEQYTNAVFENAIGSSPFKSENQTIVDLSKPVKIETDRPCVIGEVKCKEYKTGRIKGFSKRVTFDMTPAIHWVWKDSNNNGRVDADDEHERAVITTDEEKQNFANWWQYYRNRLLVMQGALALAVSPMESVRMGISTLHHNSDDERKKIANIGSDDSKGTEKRGLMDAIFQVDTSGGGGTPLRTALGQAGRYFECKSTSLFNSETLPCPVDDNKGGKCQKNFTILATDGFNTINLKGKNEVVGNADNDGKPAIPLRFDSGPYGDEAKNTLADVAMYYYERDLYPLIDNKVPVQCGIDQNPAQHMVTYAIGFGISGALSTDDLPPQTSYSSTGLKCKAEEAPTDEWPDWGDPVADNEDARANELIHAAYNGRGEFISASRAETLATALKSVLESAVAQSGSASSVAFSSGQSETDNVLYFAQFNPNHWSGDLKSYALNKSGKVSSEPVWSAATKLDQRDIEDDPRVILTYDRNDKKDGIPFAWEAIKNLGVDDPLYKDLTYSGGNDEGEEHLNYLRGERGKEKGKVDRKYRERGSRLGDIVHSGPVYVGKPELGWPDTSPFPTDENSKYSDFRKKHAKGRLGARKAMVYIGANDGMLHGFDADTGQEKLGYIPGALYSDAKTSGLHYLADPQYNHRYYVDMTPSVADAYIKTGTDAVTRSWVTLLVGTLGGGGRGIFSLDVTDPADFSEKKSKDIVLWEFTSEDDPDLGYTYSKPSIVLTNAKSGSSNRWAVIFGNGYKGSDTAQLFILFIEEGLDGTWSYNDGDYIKLDTGVGSRKNRNGLSSVSVVDTDGDWVADRVYAGDLQGNMWAFDISDEDTDKWGSAYQSGSKALPLFTGDSKQPITTAPVIIEHPTVAPENENAPNLMVYFGTGQYLTSDDIESTDMQSYYGVWDRNKGRLKRKNLQSQTLRKNVPDNGEKYRVLTSNSVEYESVDDNNKEYGWRIDFKKGKAGEKGERVVVDSFVRGSNLYFNTLIPSLDACKAGGDSWKMVVDLVNGGEPKKPAFDYNSDGVVDAEDVVKDDNNSYVNPSAQKEEGIATGSSVRGDNEYTGNSTKNEPLSRKVETLPRGNQGRISWEQLFDF